nr:RebB family R body protein [Ralstonia syzygii]
MAPQAAAAVTADQAPALAMAMTYLAMADSLGLAMGNAVANQQRGQVIAGAATARVLALIIQKGSESS